MERYEYGELKQNIREDYSRYTSVGYNFTFFGATSKILDDLRRVIWESEAESLMIYIIMAQLGLEQKELRPEIRDEVLKIINNDILVKLKAEFSIEEFDEISQDVNKIKNSICI